MYNVMRIRGIKDNLIEHNIIIYIMSKRIVCAKIIKSAS